MILEINPANISDSDFQTLANLFRWKVHGENNEWVMQNVFGETLLKTKNLDSFNFDAASLIDAKEIEGFKKGLVAVFSNLKTYFKDTEKELQGTQMLTNFVKFKQDIMDVLTKSKGEL